MNRKKLFSLAVLYSITSLVYAANTEVTPTIVARSQGRDAMRKLVGVSSQVHKYDAGRYVMVNYLIEKGVDINRSHKVDGVNQTALHAAVYGTHFTLNNDISKYEKEESRNRLENAQFYCRKVLEDLIRAGAHISARDEYERTPLHIAAKYNNLVAAEILIKAGAKLMDKDSKGKTPLDYAESAEMIKLLKDQGAKEIP